MVMNRIQRIQTFLKDYKSLTPNLKELCEEVHQHYELELINEYVRISRHSYPNEYLYS